MFTQTPVHYFFCKMILLIYLNPLKHSHVSFFCELNFVPILEFAMFYHFIIFTWINHQNFRSFVLSQV